MNILRGDLYYADPTPVTGSEQGGVRPVLMIQNDMGNRFSPTVIAAAITSRSGKHRLPTHIKLDGSFHGLHQNSMVLLEQVRTIDRAQVEDVAAEQLLSGALQAGDTALVDGAENGLRLYAQPAGTQALNTKENEL